MELKNFYAQDVNGNIVPGASCMVYLEDRVTLATGLQDAGGAALANPFTADVNGLAQFAAPNGKYYFRCVAGLLDSTIAVQFADPSEIYPLITQAQALTSQASDSATAAQNSSQAATAAVNGIQPSLDAKVNLVDLAASSRGAAGASLVGTILPATGAVARTVQDKIQSIIFVEDFGALGGATDDSAAFQAAVDASPAGGGLIKALGPAYTVNTAPSLGSKSINWDFGPATLISGTQTTFPRFATNGSCRPNGPYFRSQTAGPTIDGAASFALAVESIQPASDTNNGYGACFFGAQLNADGDYSITSAINAVATANAGSSGNIFGIEIDVATFADANKGTQFGLLISGAGGNDIKFGIRINRHGTSEKYLYGLAMVSTRIGIFVDDVKGGLENGLVLGSPPTRYANNMIQAMQISNGGSVLLMQRKTNTSPTGNFISAINADNTAQLFAVDVLGQLVAQRVEAPYLKITGAAVAPAAGQRSLGASTSTSATAGGISVPATALGFFNEFQGLTPVKVPFYAA